MCGGGPIAPSRCAHPGPGGVRVPAKPVHPIYLAGRHLPLKIRDFLDYAAPRLEQAFREPANRQPWMNVHSTSVLLPKTDVDRPSPPRQESARTCRRQWNLVAYDCCNASAPFAGQVPGLASAMEGSPTQTDVRKRFPDWSKVTHSCPRPPILSGLVSAPRPPPILSLVLRVRPWATLQQQGKARRPPRQLPERCWTTLVLCRKP